MFNQKPERIPVKGILQRSEVGDQLTVYFENDSKLSRFQGYICSSLCPHDEDCVKAFSLNGFTAEAPNEVLLFRCLFVNPNQISKEYPYQLHSTIEVIS